MVDLTDSTRFQLRSSPRFGFELAKGLDQECSLQPSRPCREQLGM